MHHRGAFYRGKNIPLRPDAWYLLDNVVLLACSILAINFFLLPSSSRFLPISFTSLSPSLSFSLSQIALRCVGGRQSGQFTLQWLVHLSLSPSVSLSLPLSILIPFLAVHSSLAHLHCRYATRGHVPYLSLARVRYLSCVRVRYVSRLRPSLLR